MELVSEHFFKYIQICRRKSHTSEKKRERQYVRQGSSKNK